MSRATVQLRCTGSIRRRFKVRRSIGGDAVRAGARFSARLGRKYETLAAVARIKRRADLVVAEPNYIRHASRVPNDPFYAYQWNYPNINLPLAWDVTQGSDHVIVAVIDTGVLLAHPDLQGQLIAGYDFIRDPDRARDGDGIDPDPNDSGDFGFGGSSTFHGTHVAGTIAANSDNGGGVAGIAWRARVMPVRALGVDGGTTYDVVKRSESPAGLPNDSNGVPPRRADILNLSLGSSFSSQVEQNTIDQARNAGVIVSPRPVTTPRAIRHFRPRTRESFRLPPPRSRARARRIPTSDQPSMSQHPAATPPPTSTATASATAWSARSATIRTARWRSATRH